MRQGRAAKRLRLEEEKARMRLNIGVDFGNTYSGTLVSRILCSSN
jgi:hypothetical protein